MGRGALIRLRYVQRWVDKPTGHAYHYFRKPGRKRVPLPGLPGSEEFMAAYRAALGGSEQSHIGERRTRTGSFSALCVSYYGSAAFNSLAPNTQRNRRRILELFRRESGSDGVENGFRSVASLTRADLQRMVDHRSKPKPTKAKDFLKAMRGLLDHAVAIQQINDSPADGVKGPKIKSKGFHSWTEENIEQYERRWPVGTTPRLGMALMLYTCQRGSDVVGMGRQHVTKNKIRVRQEKTKRELVIPMHPELARIIEATPNNHLTFLVTGFGKPYTAKGFSNAVRDWCDYAGLPQCSAHGLRKAACRRLAEVGCSASLIGAVSGHKSLKELEGYVQAASQERMAEAAMAKITPGRN